MSDGMNSISEIADAIELHGTNITSVVVYYISISDVQYNIKKNTWSHTFYVAAAFNFLYSRFASASIQLISMALVLLVNLRRQI